MKGGIKKMNRQTIGIVSFVLALTLLITPLIFAEESNITEDESNQTILLNQNIEIEDLEEIDESLNESVGEWKVFKQKLGIWFTSNPEEKTKKELDLARMRLIQARNAAKNGDTNAMEKAFEAHEKNLERVKARLEEMNGASTEKEIESSVEKLVGIERAIQVHELRIQRMEELLEEESELPEEAREKMQLRIDKANESINHLGEVQELKRERTKNKIIAIKGVSEEEAEQEIEIIENKVNEQERVSKGKNR